MFSTSHSVENMTNPTLQLKRFFIEKKLILMRSHPAEFARCSLPDFFNK